MNVEASPQPAPLTHVYACGNCGAELVVDVQVRTTTCPYCASPAVVEKPAASVRHVDPRFVVGFARNVELAKKSLAAWIKRQSILCHGGIRTATVEDLKGIYLPAYLYSAVARSQYSAEIGENYQVTETYTTMVNGKLVTRTRTVTKTEWRSLSGSYATYLSDIVTTASRGLPNAELERVEPFDLRDLRRYAPGLIAGWIAEEASLPEPECLKLARDEAVEEAGRRVARAMPGDSYRALSVSTALSQEAADLIYVPIWVMALRYAPDKPPIRVLINGQTGKAGGKAPLSPIRIAILVVLIIAAIVGIFFWVRAS
jgi:DNA-directed RNA polymerase subunit RPC12/RpoP